MEDDPEHQENQQIVGHATVKNIIRVHEIIVDLKLHLEEQED
jgi:hypothetical protein